MDSSERGQTTKGMLEQFYNYISEEMSTFHQSCRYIWLSRDKTHNLLIMDVEGSDGASRLDDQVCRSFATLVWYFKTVVPEL